MRIVIDQKACISCGACVVICPFRAIRLADGYASIDQARCTQCQKCICKCYTRAIHALKDENAPV